MTESRTRCASRGLLPSKRGGPGVIRFNVAYSGVLWQGFGPLLLWAYGTVGLEVTTHSERQTLWKKTAKSPRHEHTFRISEPAGEPYPVQWGQTGWQTTHM